jgi:hypothetical protein
VALLGLTVACGPSGSSGGGTASSNIEPGPNPTPGNDGGTPTTHDGGSPSGNDGGAPGVDSGPQGSCQAPGGACTVTTECCQGGGGVGSGGQVCISNDNACHAICSSNSECASGCCAPVQGQNYGVCATAADCQPPPPSCSHPGQSCASPSDCCSNDPNAPMGQTCLSNDNVCHALCSSSSECTSGCCIKLQGVSYGACGGYQSGYTCL